MAITTMRSRIQVGIEIYGSRLTLPRAWTIPVDVSYHFDLGGAVTVGGHTGPRFALDGGRTFGWNVGADFQDHHLFNAWTSRDLDYSLDATQLGDQVFYGVSVGVFMPRAHFWASSKKLPDPARSCVYVGMKPHPIRRSTR